MRRVTYLSLAIALTLLATPSATLAAGDGVTVEGTLLCAKCSLGEDREKCQNAITVDGENDAEAAVYYLVDNEVAKDYGHVCEESRTVRATGTVSEDGGQTWLDATAIETLAVADAAEHAGHGEDAEAGHEHSH